MTPYQLKRALEEQGLEILDVARHRLDETVAVVYLHGNAGQWAHGYALEIVQGVPGVKNATESVSTPAIIMVRLENGSSSTEAQS